MSLLEACRAWTEAHDEPGREAVREQVRETLAGSRAHAVDEAAAAFDEAIAKASAAGDEDAARVAFDGVSVPTRRPAFDAAPLANAHGEPIPEPIIQRAHDGKRVDAVVSIGEPGLLTGAGSSGKSYLALALAHAAALAMARNEPTGKACGLEVKAGPVVVVSYEYSRRRGLQRMRAIEGACGDTSGDGSRHVHLVNAPGPLYRADHRQGFIGEGEAWAPTWRYIRTIGARLLVIDSGGLALEGASVSEDRPPKVFLRALARESERARCGVLVVTHSNKARRKGDGTDADAVSGSVAWFDQARGVLDLAGGRDTTDRTLKCLKANEGVQGWSVTLAVADDHGGTFGGFKFKRAANAPAGDGAKGETYDGSGLPC